MVEAAGSSLLPLPSLSPLSLLLSPLLLPSLLTHTTQPRHPDPERAARVERGRTPVFRLCRCRCLFSSSAGPEIARVPHPSRTLRWMELKALDHPRSRRLSLNREKLSSTSGGERTCDGLRPLYPECQCRIIRSSKAREWRSLLEKYYQRIDLGFRRLLIETAG